MEARRPSGDKCAYLAVQAMELWPSRVAKVCGATPLWASAEANECRSTWADTGRNPAFLQARVMALVSQPGGRGLP